MKNKFIKASTFVIVIFTLMAFMPGSQSSRKPIYLNTTYSFEERAADLVSRLTLEEKQSLLGNNMAAIPRLGIRTYNVWSEALHGILGGAIPGSGISAPTSFPNSVALGSSWDPDLMQRESSAIADEARAIFATGTKGLTYWSPVVEPIRDPRWGRTGEAFGEDPFLVSQIAGGFIRGFMGNDPVYLKAVPTGKHYFANNSEFDRHVSSSNMDRRDMREYYLTPYKNLIEKDKLPSIMSSYNAVNGVPTSASVLYLDSIARRTYGLNGYITGDCAAIEDIYTGHYYKKTGAEATAAGLKAGVDSDCGSVYQNNTVEALNQGLITMADIDRALVNMFTVRMRTGEFDPDAKVLYSLTPGSVVSSAANKALAKEVATRTPVLLKNNVVAKTNMKALPINPAGVKKIALVGPQADEVELGPYSGRPAQENMITPLAGIKNYISSKGLSTEVVFSSGGNTSNKSNLFYVAAFELVKSNGTVTRHDATKYSSSSKGITVGSGMGSVEQVRTIDDGSWTAYDNIDLTNVDTIGIVVNIPVEGGIIEVRTGGPEGNLLTTLNANTAAGARSGGVYGAGSMMKVKVNRLGFNEPQTLYFVYKALPDKDIDKETIALAGSADVAVVFVGTDEKTATEEADRLTLLLPGNQVQLIKAVAAVNPNTIVVMQTLGCVEVEEFKNLPGVAGIIWTGYNGQAQGAAIADVLFGDANPGGKLNATWYKSVKDLPEITDYTLRGGNGKNGRTLWYFDKEVSYEFGYGLSYTTFEYSNYRISKSSFTPQDKIIVSVDVKNTGNVDGDEVVQIYVKTPDSPASLQRPIKRLKGFKRVSIPAGQAKTVNIEIKCADLWFWDMQKDKITYDQGRYVFEIGSSSKDIRGTVDGTMKGEFIPVLKTVVADGGSTVLKKGSTIQTKVSAAMTDDSFFDVSKAKVVYTSNNPAVVSVDANGLVTATGVGVASIKAEVTINDVTMSDSYPVKVMPDLTPASIKVNNKDISGFSPDVKSYSYLLAAGSKAPAVNASARVNDVALDVIQASSVPGTAVVTLTDNITVEKNTYFVNFGTKSVTDEFNTSARGAQWTAVRENPAHVSLTGKTGFLTITAAQGDITGNANNAENILLQSANTDWTIDTKVVFSKRPGMSQNGGVVAYQDDDNFLKLVYGAGGGRGFTAGGPGAVQLVAEIGGTQKNIANLSMADIIKADNTLYLRLDKKGSLYTASCSSDGKNFKPVGKTELILKDIKAGVMASNGAPMQRFGNAPAAPQQQQQTAAETPLEVSFDYFRIQNRGLK
ncbi:MAG TPA: glycoside hydrolase family 3 C-terminal domain-containing protein [Bacteroidales bacterium]|nr:glycoside hydrolase family 3 C-terminal domain-containing protein [Bacteroidales bacterium]